MLPVIKGIWELAIQQLIASSKFSKSEKIFMTGINFFNVVTPINNRLKSKSSSLYKDNNLYLIKYSRSDIDFVFSIFESKSL